jgi:hypothetical protein
VFEVSFVLSLQCHGSTTNKFRYKVQPPQKRNRRYATMITFVCNGYRERNFVCSQQK